MIQVARQADVPAIEALMNAPPGFWDASWRADVLSVAIRCADDLAVVWEENGRLLGFACAHDCGFRAYLSALIVDPGARRRGIGRQLVSEIQERLVRRGCRILISDVWPNAAGFYRRLGWSEPDALLLRKRLGPLPGHRNGI